MARGRMLNRSISLNPEVAELVNELGGLAGLVYTWTIAHLDRDGRISGNPTVLCAQVTPLIAGVTPDLVRSLLAMADRLELVDVYEADGRTWVGYPKFQQNQKGMRYDREAASTVPDNSGVSPEWVRTYSGGLRLNGMERNGKEEKGTERKSAPPKAEAQPIGGVSVSIGDVLGQINEWGGWPTPTGFTRKAKALATELGGGVTPEELEDGKREAEGTDGSPSLGLLLSIIARRRREAVAYRAEVDRLIGGDGDSHG